MYAIMVKHARKDRAYWYEVPDKLLSRVAPEKRVMCKNAYGYTVGTALSYPIEVNECTTPVMTASGAAFPFSPIVSTEKVVDIGDIRVPSYMIESEPSDEKLAKRFLEYYHTGHFDTNVVISEDGKLLDGYTAYVVAVMLNLHSIPAVIRHKEERKYD